MILAVVLLVLLVTGGILEEIFVDKLLSEFEEKLADIADTPGGNYDYDKIQETYEWWIEKNNSMEMFLPHIPLNDVTLALGEMRGAVQAGDYDNATAQLNRIFAAVDTLKDTFSLSISNIF
jgi:hypothetical protein